MKTAPEPTSLLTGITHKEVLAIMDRDEILGVSVDKFTRLLAWAQQRAFDAIAKADDERIKEANKESV